jgi:CheY-like chemotaxis protein
MAELLCEARHGADGDITVTARDDGSRLVISLVSQGGPSSVQSAPLVSCVAGPLIQMHGGAIRAEADPDVRRILVELPLVDEARPVPTRLVGPPLRVLIVEDDDHCARSLEVALDALGYKVALAHDGAVALEIGACFEPDVILLDLGLPVLDGWEVARRLREQLGPLPIIAVTGRVDLDDATRSTEAGCIYHLRKPVDLERLRGCLSAVGRDGVGAARTA